MNPYAFAVYASAVLTIALITFLAAHRGGEDIRVGLFAGVIVGVLWPLIIPTVLVYCTVSMIRMRCAPWALLLMACCAVHGSEVLDPPNIDGWKYSHRAYHAVAGALIDIGTQELIHHAAPQWAKAHPVWTQVVAGLVVGTAGVGKEVIDRAHGGEQLHHSLMDIAVTTGGGVVAGFAWSYRW